MQAVSFFARIELNNAQMCLYADFFLLQKMAKGLTSLELIDLSGCEVTELAYQLDFSCNAIIIARGLLMLEYNR